MPCQSGLQNISSAGKIKMPTHIKNYNITKADLRPKWHVIDANGQTLGRLSSEIATLLQGKHKPSYAHNLLTGDFVVVINGDKFKVTGNKLLSKKYYRHSGYIGGLTEQTMEEMLDKFPERVITQSVKGMLPKNKLGRKMLLRLKVYAGDQHPHEAQIKESNNLVHEVAEAKPKAEDINLAGLTIPKLKELATSRGLTIPGKARKADIIEMISKAE